ncbi:MAG: translation initiation factor IF-2 subunit beta [Nanoarchaeota archaeon]|nr:translation initiation factor IF-2 subunit beta [Nanoarchaeota archaeon]MBU0962790.1 translation initiation factor IF-2 subunit beta [Nanoarchaeota archaeon]
MEDYLKLLDNAVKNIPKEVFEITRIEIPKATGRIEGNKTIVNNFNQICKFFDRDPQHILKFLLRELATPAKLEENRLIFGRKVSPNLINEKLKLYADIYVFCPICKKPDTHLIYEGDKLYIKCTACGVKSNVKEKV